ncbi:MAG TPA: transposase [Microbacteriaceae bacterium]|nr:transposase [Microbacteriaceae bacterium]
MAKPYDKDFKERALRMLAEARPEHASLHAASQHIGGLLGVSPDTLRIWFRQTQVDAGERPGVTTDIAEENKRLMRENAELRKANEVLKAASIFFAQEQGRPRTK